MIDAERSKKLFEVPAKMENESLTISDNTIFTLRNAIESQENDILISNAERNSKFFDDELDKLESWADDLKSSIKMELKELDREIKYRKTESKRILNLEDKIREQREIKELEKKRNALRLNLFQAQDEIDERKESLITSIEAKLKQRVSTFDLFLFRWFLVEDK
ncbi:MAG: hypothetical protein GW805_05300 [Ignavibacteria bacterium]|nr:hypothetical protein [Ignavibacteria bacterium]OIO15583.1 MAG: hypothetical protein AUJ54_12685 [Ignavibacteria bacterium CG1_02_37_35]PIS44347.1 MAG: hypothetical protein COT22_11000 [Ignavibacteria bacterium CG08_land_8_20_14_0_20_37_9]PIX95283.1 MAG: hypothetical protein COZ25_01170 [Ignavibacteria bacterium CG_4_10_14_3_um_filter_37_18]PJC60539.1 MAG: hypothetical protein CO025_02850 [Ignavibacteria bacterium CG_4_9_14_0_2_um_filter_37_13]